MNFAAAAEWLTSVGPLMVPLVASWLEQRGMRRELHQLRKELLETRDKQVSNETRLGLLEVRVTKIEGVVIP